MIWTGLNYPKQSSLRGQASLEMLIVLLMLVPLIFGGIELSRAVAIHSALDSGTAVATRMLALNPGQVSEATAMVNNAVHQNIMGTSGLGAVHMNSDPAPVSGVSFGATFCITSTAEFTPSIPFLTVTTIHLKVTHCAVMERMN
jgi:Flp pilus assembly protein TadG